MADPKIDLLDTTIESLLSRPHTRSITPKGCPLCGQPVKPGDQVVRLKAGTVHRHCRPSWAPLEPEPRG